LVHSTAPLLSALAPMAVEQGKVLAKKYLAGS
jgi:hypothetical protein